MRRLRACLLLVLMTSASCLVVVLARGPVREGWRALRSSSGPAAGSSAGDLTALLQAGCALVAGLAWLWLLVAVGACTWDVVRTGPAGVSLPTPDVGSSPWRPRVVRMLVAAFLGVTALAGPAALAQPPDARIRSRPDDLGPTSVTPAMTLGLLDGLPVPDRVPGRARDRAPGQAPVHAPERAVERGPDRGSTAGRTLRVAPGDSLWSLTAGLLPPGTPAGTVAAGWRLLYGANREVVGPDPDLLHPGQTLRTDAALEALLEAARTDGSRPSQPLHHLGGSR